MKGQEDEEGGEGMRQGCKTETSKRKVRNLALPHFESDVKCGTVVKLHEWCKMLWLGWAAPVVLLSIGAISCGISVALVLK